MKKLTLRERMRERFSHIEKTLQGDRPSKAKRFFLWLVIIGVAATLVGLFLFTVAIAVLSVGLPDVRQFDSLAGIESTVIFDREGGILYTVHGEENRKYVPLDQIAPYLQKATISIEDDAFYAHSGFDIPGIVRAVLHEAFGFGIPSGGSTITQQLAKNAFLTREHSYTRKLKELIIAVRLERAYDKDKILELYLNRIPYGQNAYGAEMAAQLYFNKSARELTLPESVVLAALPNAPTYYSPYGSHEFSSLDRTFTADEFGGKVPKLEELDSKDYTIGLLGKDVDMGDGRKIFVPGRANVILRRMAELGNITQQQLEESNKALASIEFTRYRETIRAPHFVFEIRRQLEEKFGKDIVAQGGMRVYTTLNPKYQDAAEQAVADQIKISKDRHGVTTGALYSIDTKTGEVLAMVGSADYFDLEAHGNVNHVFSKLQPGSSFKPIVYAKAFLNGYAPATVIYDTPTDFGGGYRPDNYEGGFRGPMSIRQALGQSRNLPALKAYFMAGQQQELIPFARKMGLESLNENGDYGPPLAIGAGEVTLAEMVQAFSVFANNGVKRTPYDIVKVVDREGTIMYERHPEENVEETILDPQVAYEITSILTDKSVWLGGNLNVPGHTTGAKTGTSNKEISKNKILPSNLWTMGYSTSVVTGVWTGNSDGSALKPNADGYTVSAPIWANYMKKVHEGKPDDKFEIPAGIKTMGVAKASGKLITDVTPLTGRVTDIFASFAVPTEPDDIYVQVEVVKQDGLLPNEFTPPDQIEKRVFMNHHDPLTSFPNWLAGIKQWVKGSREKDSNSIADFPPTEKTKLYSAKTADSVPTIQITSPAAYSTATEQKVNVSVKFSAPNGVDKISYYLDDRTTPYVTKRKAPFDGWVKFPKTATSGTHIISVKITDKLGYAAEARIEVNYDATAAAANPSSSSADEEVIPVDSPAAETTPLGLPVDLPKFTIP